MFYTAIHNKHITVVNDVSNNPLAISLIIHWNLHRLITWPCFTAEGVCFWPPCRSGVCNYTPIVSGVEMKDKFANSFCSTKYRNGILHIFIIYILLNMFSSMLMNWKSQSDPHILLMPRSRSIFSTPVQTSTSQLSANGVGYGNKYEISSSSCSNECRNSRLDTLFIYKCRDWFPSSLVKNKSKSKY